MATFKKKPAPKPTKAPIQVQADPVQKIAPQTIVTSFSLMKIGTYWHVVTTKTQGDKVISTVLGKPAPKAASLIEFRITVGRFLMTFS